MDRPLLETDMWRRVPDAPEETSRCPLLGATQKWMGGGYLVWFGQPLLTPRHHVTAGAVARRCLFLSNKHHHPREGRLKGMRHRIKQQKKLKGALKAF